MHFIGGVARFNKMAYRAQPGPVYLKLTVDMGLVFSVAGHSKHLVGPAGLL